MITRSLANDPIADCKAAVASALFVISALCLTRTADATWSIVAVDATTKEVGIAGASCTNHVMGIAALVPGKGANVSQAMSNPLAWDVAQTLLAEGKCPSEILKVITRREFAPEDQQYGIVAVGFEDDSAAYTGDNCADIKGHLTGMGVCVQGNILVDDGMLLAVMNAFNDASKDPTLTLADRLLRALEAGSAHGGDRRCGDQTARSAFLMVAKPTDTYSDLHLSINIPGQKPGGPNPCQLLAEQYRKWRKYDQQLDPFIRQALRETKTPGLAIGVLEDGRLIYSRGFGEMISGIKQYPISTRTVFHMASVTKPFVATAIMQLVEDGKIDLDASVITYLPYFRLKDERFKSITVRQLLTHTSGMSDVTDFQWDRPSYDDGALERHVRSLAEMDLRFEPGSDFAYSNIGFNVLGDVVSKVSEQSFEDFVETRILKPLGMASSTLFLDRAEPANLAPGYTLNEACAVIGPYHRFN